MVEGSAGAPRRASATKFEKGDDDDIARAVAWPSVFARALRRNRKPVDEAEKTAASNPPKFRRRSDKSDHAPRPIAGAHPDDIENE